MAKTKISEYSSTAANNTDINSINLAEGMAPSLVNNAIRQLMAQLKNFQDGSAGDSVTVGGNLSVTGTSTLTGAITATGGVSGAVTSSSATITGGTITGITDLAVADGGTGASTAANARTNLSAASSGANSDITSITGLTTALTVAQGGTGVTTSTGTGNVVLSTSPTLVTPALGTPTSATLTNATGLPISTGVSGLGTGIATALAVNVGSAGAPLVNGGVLGTPSSGTATNLTGLPISTGVSGLGTGVATFLGTPSSANLASAVTDETGSGALVFANSPTLVTPALGTPASGVLTNATGLPISTGVSGLGTGVATFLATPSSANLISAVTDETGTGSLVFATSPTLVTPALGTPSALVGTNITGTASGLTAGNVTTNANLTGAVTSVGNATSLGSFSSANLLSALTDETGTGVVVFSTSPTLVTPILGTPTSATLTNATGLPLTTGVTGQLPVANGGTGTATPSIVAGTNVTVTGTWPNQTIAASGGGGGGVSYTAVKTANYTAANNDGVLTNTTGGAFTVTLPTSPSVGNIVIVIDSFSQWGTNNLTIDPTALIKIAGNTAGDTLVCDITGATVTLVYTGATYGWNVAAQVGGNGGTAVTLTGTQTLTNKTLTTPTLTTPVASTTIGVGGATASASGAGITFPATQSASTDANTLDDYEEGTWTATDASGASLSFTSATHRYTKVGRLVSLQVDELTFPSNADGNAVLIGGLPFTAGTSAGSGGVTNYTGSAVQFLILGGASQLRLYNVPTSYSRTTNADMSTRALFTSITYSV